MPSAPPAPPAPPDTGKHYGGGHSGGKRVVWVRAHMRKRRDGTLVPVRAHIRERRGL